jgi:nicotinate-nucleotide--dimethylbenzimidazole phosphoribosyltransferase
MRELPNRRPEFDSSRGASSIGEILDLLGHMPDGDSVARAACLSRESQLTKPQGALGRLEELSAWLAFWQGAAPKLEKPLVCVFAANHGVAARGVSAYPAAVTAQMVANFRDGGAAINQLARAIDAELRVFELSLDRPTCDFTQEPAMDEPEFLHAFSIGMKAVTPGCDVLCLGEMGIANTTAAAALGHGLFGGIAEEWTGPGTGVSGEGLARKAEVVRDGVRINRDTMTNAVQVLRCLGGRELAAIAGAVLAARYLRIPVLLDGYVCTAAAAALYAADPRALDHCRIAHVSAEPGHRRLVECLNQKPLLDLNMRLGEGSGAALAVFLLKGAVACHNGMATFAEAGVSGKS